MFGSLERRYWHRKSMLVPNSIASILRLIIASDIDQSSKNPLQSWIDDKTWCIWLIISVRCYYNTIAQEDWKAGRGEWQFQLEMGWLTSSDAWWNFVKRLDVALIQVNEVVAANDESALLAWCSASRSVWVTCSCTRRIRLYHQAGFFTCLL